MGEIDGEACKAVSPIAFVLSLSTLRRLVLTRRSKCRGKWKKLHSFSVCIWRLHSLSTITTCTLHDRIESSKTFRHSAVHLFRSKVPSERSPQRDEVFQVSNAKKSYVDHANELCNVSNVPRSSTWYAGKSEAGTIWRFVFGGTNLKERVLKWGLEGFNNTQ